jgi:hypothetical protein
MYKTYIDLDLTLFKSNDTHTGHFWLKISWQKSAVRAMNLLAEGNTVFRKCSVLEKDKNSVRSIVYLRESLNQPQ